MPYYVSLVNFTEQGIAAIKDTVKRAEKARELAESMGGSIESIYWTVGPYDVVVTSEFADDETNTAWILKLGSQGNIRTTTMRAFNEGEMVGVLKKIPASSA